MSVGVATTEDEVAVLPHPKVITADVHDVGGLAVSDGELHEQRHEAECLDGGTECHRSSSVIGVMRRTIPSAVTDIFGLGRRRAAPSLFRRKT